LAWSPLGTGCTPRGDYPPTVHPPRRLSPYTHIPHPRKTIPLQFTPRGDYPPIQHPPRRLSPNTAPPPEETGVSVQWRAAPASLYRSSASPVPVSRFNYFFKYMTAASYFSCVVFLVAHRHCCWKVKNLSWRSTQEVACEIRILRVDNKSNSVR
jgi:hypothetical protein